MCYFALPMQVFFLGLENPDFNKLAAISFLVSIFIIFFNFQLVFLILNKHEQNFIVSNNGIHRINSCKINLDLGRDMTSMMFSSILILEKIVWYLIGFSL